MKKAKQVTVIVLITLMAFVFIPFTGNMNAYATDYSLGTLTLDFDLSYWYVLEGRDREAFNNTTLALVMRDAIAMLGDDNDFWVDINGDMKSDIVCYDDTNSIDLKAGVHRGETLTMKLSDADRQKLQSEGKWYFDKIVCKYSSKSLNDENAKVQTVAPVKYYTGSAIKPEPKVWYNGELLTKGTDYTLSYGTNTKISTTGTVTVKGKGEYSGTVQKTFAIKGNLGYAATKVSVQPIAKKTYTGTDIEPMPYVKAVLPGGSIGKLTPGTSFEYAYKNNVNVGKASLIIKGKNKYAGSKTVYFTIGPKGTTISGLKSLSKGFKVTWKKQTTQTSGYDIIYSSKSDFSTYAIKTVAGNGNYVKSITGLRAYKKYYVKVRTYKMVDGVKYLSAWSKVSTVITNG